MTTKSVHSYRQHSPTNLKKCVATSAVFFLSGPVGRFFVVGGESFGVTYALIITIFIDLSQEILNMIGGSEKKASL